MSLQVYFTISIRCEEELFAFILDECKCRIFLPESITGEFSFEKGDRIIYHKYLISPFSADFSFRTEKRLSNYSSQETWMIYPFDDNNNLLPFLEYERDLSYDRADIISARLYLRTLSISPRFRSEAKLLFQKIKKWIVANSSGKEVEDNISFYEVDGFHTIE